MPMAAAPSGCVHTATRSSGKRPLPCRSRSASAAATQPRGGERAGPKRGTQSSQLSKLRSLNLHLFSSLQFPIVVLVHSEYLSFYVNVLKHLWFLQIPFQLGRMLAWPDVWGRGTGTGVTEGPAPLCTAPGAPGRRWQELARGGKGKGAAAGWVR